MSSLFEQILEHQLLQKCKSHFPTVTSQDGEMLQLTATTGRNLEKYNNILSCLWSYFHFG